MPTEAEQFINDLYNSCHLTRMEKSELQRVKDLIEYFQLPNDWEIILRIHILLENEYAASNFEIANESIAVISNIISSHPLPEYQVWHALFQGRIFHTQAVYEEAILWYRKAISLGKEIGHRANPQSLFRLGQVYNLFGATEQAIECLTESIATANDNFRIASFSLSELSYIYLSKGRNEDALEVCHRALEIIPTESIRVYARLKLRECSILLELNRLDELFNIIDILSPSLQKLGDTSLISASKAILGKAFRIKGNYIESEKNIREAISIYKEDYQGQTFALTNSLLHLAELQIDTNTFDKAYHTLNEAKEIATKVNEVYSIVGCHEVFVNLYTKQGEYEKALSAFREFYEAKQKMLSDQAARRMDLLRIEYHVRQKEQEAEQYRLKSEQLEKDLMDKTTHLISQVDTLSRFRDDLRQILSTATDPILGIKKVKEKLKDLPSVSLNWEEYDKNFSAVHPKFKQNLVEKCPSLTPMELKVCALLRLELTSKEIAGLLNISERSVENHRYRSRKKIGLAEHENIFNFLNSL